MAAPNFKLDNLYVIIDKNNFQQTGSNKEIMNVGNLKDKWSSFGWYTVELDGHNVKDHYNFFQEFQLEFWTLDPLSPPNDLW